MFIQSTVNMVGTCQKITNLILEAIWERFQL